MATLSTEAVLEPQETIRVNALHALNYCPRLYYLEEVEQLYTQDAAVFAGRRLHVELEKDEDGDWQQFVLENEHLGLRGKVDALRTRNGQTIPYEHKRGRCYRDSNNKAQAWESDRIQVLAYALLIEAELGIVVPEGRVRYHADNVLVHVPLDDQGRQDVLNCIERARQLRLSPERPPVATNERLCARCSLAPVCLPEEARLAQGQTEHVVRLFPEDDERQVIHVTEAGTRIGKSGDQFKITKRDGKTVTLPSRQVSQLVVHSYAQLSTQAIYFCAEQDVGIHFISGGGRYLASLDTRQGSIQRRIGQYKALSQPEQCLQLARQLVECRGQSQRKFLMRGQRNADQHRDALEQAIAQMQKTLKGVPTTQSIASLLGLEGNLASLYFGALPHLISDNVALGMKFSGRNRRPPKDRFNALLSFGYSMLLKDVMNAILTIGLEPALGFYHQPRTQAPPLALDLMEIFRVPLVDMPVMASVNRNQWDVDADFNIQRDQVWLSDEGRRKFISLYERRKEEKWKHPVTQYSLTYRRLIELEVRLLEKEWMGEGGLFAQLVVR
ncbi:type I-MYXAN CRISPR-associated endonuclease Cas1 [Nodosilinea sp. LEGE 07088]|uniref:type I-MYXAN CRISPR-associated endonuclease Cas4/Cas1 n=1 Tax=Nodosilinea sp. LEGE 07088 TaxID=2777968 RepID=UPI001880AFB6|nr:type I-MYXAN CRISPR-associated endonuclease Cas1 [Nodosilinea sp. LEGE 07088]MBE9140270.1 type I-MYXAN CRISPR-associated endonuclease Cas1 [Nodosilinea sp. LEGE 07088]